MLCTYLSCDLSLLLPSASGAVMASGLMEVIGRPGWLTGDEAIGFSVLNMERLVSGKRK